AEDPTALAMAIIRRLNEYMSCEPTYKFKETPVDGEGALYNKPGTAYLAPGHLHAPDGDPAHEANKGGFRASDVSVHRMPEPTHGGGNIFGKTIPSEDRKTRSFREPVEHKDGGTGGVNSGT
ncbi:MAG: hypothetical protein ACRDFB_05175, partial [Rhabdochlamydiaceae bacterium]